MKVKIRDTVYNSEDEAICVEFSDDDKENIKSMVDGAHKYCSYPPNIPTRDIEEFMKF